MKKKPELTHKINNEVANRIYAIVSGKYQQAALGTIDKTGCPMVTKIVPMLHNERIYLLLSDLSEHTKNISKEKNVSIYFAEKEIHKIRSNNPRLTLQGTLEKMSLQKDSPHFQILLNQYSKLESGSKMWGMFSDFNFYIFTESRKLFVEGFGKAYEESI